MKKMCQKICSLWETFFLSFCCLIANECRFWGSVVNYQAHTMNTERPGWHLYYFPQCCDKMPDKSSLQKEGLLWPPALRVHSITMRILHYGEDTPSWGRYSIMVDYSIMVRILYHGEDTLSCWGYSIMLRILHHGKDTLMVRILYQG